MSIRDSYYFSYAGIVSEAYGIYNVNISDGMQEEPLAASREINAISIKGRDQPYFQNIKKDPLKFNVSFAFEDTYDTQKLREITRWLTEQKYYQELYFTNDLGRNPEKIYYAIAVNDPILIHNSLKQGYVTMTFQCDSPYAYSPIMTSRLYKWDQVTYNDVIADFSQGDKISVITDTDGGLILNPHRTKLSDFPYNIKLTELDQLFL